MKNKKKEKPLSITDTLIDRIDKELLDLDKRHEELWAARNVLATYETEDSDLAILGRVAYLLHL